MLALVLLIFSTVSAVVKRIDNSTGALKRDKTNDSLDLQDDRPLTAVE